MNLNEFLNVLISNKIVSSVVAVIAGFVIYSVINRILNSKKKDSLKFMISNKSETYIKMISNTLRYVFLIITLLIVLQINDVDVSGMLAGIGLVSVVIGLAIQDALKDIIRGFSILSDDYFSVGDVIKYGDIEAKVLVIGLKTTKVRSIINQNVISIANRNIEKVEVVSTQLDIEVPLSYELSKEKAEEIIRIAIDNIKTNSKVRSCEYRGINKLDDSSINYLIRIQCEQETKPQTRRDSICKIVEVLEKNGIEIPYKQIDIHNK
ncbi:MAG: mechanosensitive ion channel family protein [Bacilli bacterium]|nr:mechanosensitive ion channel family protein [Bacilli bacterium]